MSTRTCTGCNAPLDPCLTAEGDTTHPGCEPTTPTTPNVEPEQPDLFADSTTDTEPEEGVITTNHDAGSLSEPGDLDAYPATEPAVPEPEQDRTGRRAVVTWASEIEPEPVVWAWAPDDQGRIPSGSLSVAAGREGTGKSSFGIWLAAQITRGLLPGSFYGTPRRVYYIAVEDSWKYTLAPRLMAAGADLSKIGRFEVVSEIGDELTLSLPSDNSLLEKEMACHGVALVVIDPLMSVIGAKIDTHRERDVRTALDPLAKLADRTGSVVLGIAHFNKGGGTDAASLITGSGAFKNVPRSVFGFARDEADDDGGRVMSQVKNSLGRDDLPSLSYLIESAEVQTKKGITTTGRFVFTGESERSVAEVLRTSQFGAPEGDDRREIDAWLTEYLKTDGGAAQARDVLRDGRLSGFSEDALKKARRRLGIDSRRQGFGKGSTVVWSIDAAIGAIDAREQNPAPMAPMSAPMELNAAQESTKGARARGTEACTLAPLPAPLPPEEHTTT